ncbi:hypothetical protein BG011_007989 [Mortierella polycephala]|uniref:MSP domain-containing protein n=1 Tax=Mortierella polycephala TaxID=41804 RepID=A0A9P6TY14_9FUNG|nr:hypothetical protein BG011_007989 [Mortierella polycephala]
MTAAASAATASTNPQTPALLRISPQNFQFTASKVSSGLVSKLKIKNLSSTPMGYKFKTNAPLRYSVKPVLGVLASGQSTEVFVRCESWVNPQDRFLLQSVALAEEESEHIDAVTWKELDRRRINESFIQCSSSSTLALRDPQDEIGSLSSSSNSSSTISSAVSSAYSDNTRPPRSFQQNQPQQPGLSVPKKPNVAHVHAVSRKMSTSSSVSTSSSPGPYPARFSSKTGMAPNRDSSTVVPIVLLSKPVQYVATKLSNSKQTIKTVFRFLAVRQYTKIQVLTVSVACLLLGLLLPLEKIFMLTSGGPHNPDTSSTQFQNGVIGSRAAIFSSSASSSTGVRPILVTTQPNLGTASKLAGSTKIPKETENPYDETSLAPDSWQPDDVHPVTEVEGAV